MTTCRIGLRSNALFFTPSLSPNSDPCLLQTPHSALRGLSGLTSVSARVVGVSWTHTTSHTRWGERLSPTCWPAHRTPLRGQSNEALECKRVICVFLHQRTHYGVGIAMWGGGDRKMALTHPPSHAPSYPDPMATARQTDSWWNFRSDTMPATIMHLCTRLLISGVQ